MEYMEYILLAFCAGFCVGVSFMAIYLHHEGSKFDDWTGEDDDR